MKSEIFTTPNSTHWSANYFSLPPTASNPGTTYTTSYNYDLNGNLTNTTQGATTTTYTWDYNNRMLTSAGTGLPSLSYIYDPAGNRLEQKTATSTTIYPSRFYSVTLSGANSTSTEYIYGGDILLATIDQPMINGVATGSSTVRFVHTDNLGSTQATSDTHANLVQSFDYAPYGRVLSSTGSGIKKQFIDQYFDSSGLNYLNARYLNTAQGQFISEDPVFWSKQNLVDPQSLNSYSYAENNPIAREDPKGLYSMYQAATGQITWGQYWGEVNQGAMILGQDPAWNFAMNHPIATGGIVGVASLPALYAGEALSGAYTMATSQGVSTAFAAKNAFAAVVYASLVGGSTLDIPGVVNSFSSANLNNPASFYSGAWSLATQIGPNFAGEYLGSISDAFQFSKMVVNGLGSAASDLFSSSVQTRLSTTQTFNSTLSNSSSGGGGSMPNSNSLWVTPSGAVVTFGGNLVAPPPSKK